jgi:hypothetical protein
MDWSQDSCLSGLFLAKLTEVLNYHEQIILSQNLNPVLRRVGNKRTTWVYVLGQTNHFELLCQTAAQSKKSLHNRLDGCDR